MDYPHFRSTIAQLRRIIRRAGGTTDEIREAREACLVAAANLSRAEVRSTILATIEAVESLAELERQRQRLAERRAEAEKARTP